ncbi:uncharacterized protein LOC103511127 [Diaphorina citri]|uniref:Uncharacterized protein LOC103511127 n=1 Tax=Diaphorina citri TaxID=121845 RepID=A0A1S3D5R6_DIACI|nr:uncharacterized protein LOC103511127 [Diaphorina citri]
MAGSKGKGTTRVRPFSSGTINFPDEEESDLPVRIDLQGKNKNKSGAHSTASSCLNGSTVCEKVDNYPEDDILNEILSKTKGLSLFSTVDLVSTNFSIYFITEELKIYVCMLSYLTNTSLYLYFI